MIAAGFDDTTAIGPILAPAHRKRAAARIAGDTVNTNRMMAGMALRAEPPPATLGRWNLPFRNDDGTPVTEVQHLTDREHAHAYEQPAQS